MRTLIWHKLIIAAIVLLALMTCTKLSVNQTAPDVPSAPSPADGGSLDSVAIELSWTCSDPNGDPLTYDIYLDTSSTPEVLVATVDTTSYTPVGLHYNSTYYWQVVATDTTGLETGGPIWSFSFGADMIVPSCSLIAPNGGELWYIGADYDITWEASDDDSMAFFVLEYSIDEINNWVMIGDTISGNTRDTSWTIPSTPTLIGRVRIFCQDFGGNAVSDTSDTVFTIWPQGGMIAFSSDRDGTYDIFTMFSDGTNQQNILNTPGEHDYDPDWSPDCSNIVFRSHRDGNGQIYVMNLAGGNQINISNSTFEDDYPVWSPLGDKIAFSRLTATGGWEIFKINPDGSGQSNITNNAAHDSYCSWSPTADQLVFHTNRDAGNYDIYSMDEDGSTPQRLTSNASTDAWPSWSPDGLLIAFVSYRDGGAAEIYTMNANGSNPLRRTTNAFTDFWPRWSPEGRILFMSDRSGDFEIWVMDADGGNPENLSNSLDEDSYGSWSPIH